MKAVIFGAGNIGKGFVGLELASSGYELVFVDAVQAVVDSLQKTKRFTVEYLEESKERCTVKIAGAFHVSDEDAVRRMVSLSDVVVTAVGPNNLESVGVLIAKGLGDSKGKVIIAAENVPNNSWVLRDVVQRFGSYDAVFPRCVVDRISMTVDNVTKVERAFEWVIEDFGRDLNISGVEYVSNLTPYMQRKLLVLNGSHAILGWLGYAAGFVFSSEAMQNSGICKVVVGAMGEAAAVVGKEWGFDDAVMRAYTDGVVRRFANVVVLDKTERLAKDPVRKLRERVVAAALLAQKHGLETAFLEQGIIAGLKYDNPADKESVRIQETIRKVGIEGVLESYCGVSKDNILVQKVKKQWCVQNF